MLNTLSFGPALVENGAILDGIEDVEIDTNFGNHSIQGEQPRTAVGVIGIIYADPNHRWGLAPFHYTPDVYRHVIDQLRAEGYRVYPKR